MLQNIWRCRKKAVLLHRQTKKQTIMVDLQYTSQPQVTMQPDYLCSLKEAMTHSITLEESERRVDAMLDAFYHSKK